MTITFVVLILAAVCFVSGRIRADLVAICAALSLVLTGVLTPEEALSGFSNPIVIMMGALFIVGGGIFSTGLARRIGTGILRLAGENETRLFVLLMLATAFVGAFVSNTGTVALMLPIVVSMSRSMGGNPSRLLMPLAFAGSMGGMLTLIGTPPNLIIRDTLEAAGFETLRFFSFTPVGLICITVGTLALLPLSRRFLRFERKQQISPKGKSLKELTEEYGVGRGLTALRISPNTVLCGTTPAQADIYARYGVTILEIRRTSGGKGALRRISQYALPDCVMEAGDVLYVTGSKEQIHLFATEERLTVLSSDKTARKLGFWEVGMAEVLLLPNSSWVGRTIAELEFRTRFGLNVLGIRRSDAYLLENLKGRRLRASDIVLVQGPWNNVSQLEQRGGTDWVVLGRPGEQAARVTLDHKAPLAALIMVAMVICMAFDFIPVAPVTAVTLAAVAMIFTGCLRSMEEAYKTINWESLILFGAMLPMSVALEKTGASHLISSSLVRAVGDWGPYALLAAVYASTSLLTFFISNTVTALLMAPIALSAAMEQGVNPVPFLMAVTVAASMCFASPFSTPPNALVMSAGSYKPMDYVKVGLPLQFIIALVMLVALPLIYGW